jgi:LmbE family N-acetylglucosaminyl deacetylase
MHSARVGTNSSKRLGNFLNALAAPERSRLEASGVAIVVAHPDDETIACGAQLARLERATIVVVTDGAPRNLDDARRCGFRTAEDYARAREREFSAVLDMAGVAPEWALRLRVPDQQAAFRLTQITQVLVQLFALRRIQLALTHAYEGGHPDHDAVAFSVHSAAAILRGAGTNMAIVEMPLYRLGENGIVYQSFCGPAQAGETAVRLTRKEQALKRRMIAAYVTQAGVLAPFATEVERFRPAPHYDFAQLPNGGRLLYECYDWGLDGAQWIRLARSAMAEICVSENFC